jgi:hypothetical protein
MFYHLQDLLGKVVTIKTNTGHEYIATLLGMNADRDILTLADPKVVSVTLNANNTQNVFMMPYTLTSDNTEVFMQTMNILSIMDTMPATAEEYANLIQEEKQRQASDSHPEELVVEG